MPRRSVEDKQQQGTGSLAEVDARMTNALRRTREAKRSRPNMTLTALLTNKTMGNESSTECDSTNTKHKTRLGNYPRTFSDNSWQATRRDVNEMDSNEDGQKLLL